MRSQSEKGPMHRNGPFYQRLTARYAVHLEITAYQPASGLEKWNFCIQNIHKFGHLSASSYGCSHLHTKSRVRKGPYTEYMSFIFMYLHALPDTSFPGHPRDAKLLPNNRHGKIQ